MTPSEHAQHYLAQAEEFVTRRDQAISAGETARVEYLMDQIDEYLDLALEQLEDTP